MLKILWKRGEIAPEEQFLLLFTIFSYLMLGFYVKTRIGFSLRDKRLFEITEVEITRVDCISLICVSLLNSGNAVQSTRFNFVLNMDFHLLVGLNIFLFQISIHIYIDTIHKIGLERDWFQYNYRRLI